MTKRLKSLLESYKSDYHLVTNVATNDLVTRTQRRQEILEETDVDARLVRICAYLDGETAFIDAEKRIAERVQQQVQDGQKEYYLREQIKAISAELGDDVNEKEEYYNKIKSCGMPAEVVEKAKKEVARQKWRPLHPTLRLFATIWIGLWTFLG